MQTIIKFLKSIFLIDLLKGMGFTKVTALRIPTSFKADWVDQHYPVERGEAK